MVGFVAALDRHDEAAMLELMDPDVQFTSLIQQVEGTFRGHDGLRAYLGNLFATFPDFRVAADEVVTRGEATVVRVRARATGASGGVRIDLCDWLAMSARAGKAIWWSFFHSSEEALAACEAAAEGSRPRA
jgi:ketosteroid isomerase-like protein